MNAPAPTAPYTLAALVDEAWRQIMLDPELAGELGRQIVRRAQQERDPIAEAYGVMHGAFHQMRVAAIDAAEAAVARARARCVELGVPAAIWLCDDARGFLAVRRGDFASAMEIGQANEAIDPATRAPQGRAITLLLQHTACHQSLRFDAALRYGQKHLVLAEAIGDVGQQALALNNLSAVHLNVFNVEDALPLQRQANAIWSALHARARLGLSVNNLIAICDALELHQQAYDALQAWLRQPGGVDPEDLLHYNSRIALALLGVDRDDEAEQHLASGPYKSPVNPRTEAWWSWTQARLLNRRRRHEAARALCQSYLDTRPSRPIADAPYDIVQLYDAIRIASEALGDRERASAAAREAHAACVPLVGSSVRARYVSMLLQRSPDLEPGPTNAHGLRLEALGRGVRAYGQAIAADAAAPAPAPPRLDEPAKLTRSPFLAQVSHEMRTPLNGLMGMTSLLLLSNLDDRQRRLATLAQSSAEVLLRLVNDILDLAKMEAGQFQLDPQPLAPGAFAKDVVDGFRLRAGEKRLTLMLTLARTLPASVRGDAVRLHQVLGNLIDNAIKFTASGEIAVGVDRVDRIEAADADAPGSCRLRFEVRDTGKGISEAAQQRLFNEFEHADAADAHAPGATGLGLALSRQLVQRMGGTIGVHSQLGTGSRFWFDVPLALA